MTIMKNKKQFRQGDVLIEPDGSFKDYFLRVPPNMERARQAVAWTFDKAENEYAPCLET